MKKAIIIFFLLMSALISCTREKNESRTAPSPRASAYPVSRPAAVPEASQTMTAPDRSGYYKPDFSGSEKKAFNHYLAANKCFEKRDFAGAEKEYLVALKLAPKSHSATLSLAHVYFEESRLPEEKATLEKLVEFYPDDGYARWMLSEILLKQGKNDEAIKQLNLSVGLGEGKLYSIESYLLLGYAYYLKGDYQKALVGLEKAQAVLKQFCEDPERRLQISSMLGMMIFAADYFEYNLPSKNGGKYEMGPSLREAQKLLDKGRYEEALFITGKALEHLKKEMAKKNIPPPKSEFEAGDRLPDRTSKKSKNLPD